MSLANAAWVEDAEVLVRNSEGSTADPSTWKIAVLEVHPRRVPFYVGFKPLEGHAKFLNLEVITENAMFGMRLGDKPVYFIVRPQDRRTRLTIELVEVTDEMNPNYANLPLY